MTVKQLLANIIDTLAEGRIGINSPVHVWAYGDTENVAVDATDCSDGVFSLVPGSHLALMPDEPEGDQEL